MSPTISEKMEISNGNVTQNGLTKEEAAVYDRQIRLWGIEAQNKLRNSSVLIVGMSQLGAEFAKNITLAGLKSLTLMDSENVATDDIGTNFMFHLEDKELLGKNRAEASFARTHALNPNVHLSYIANGLAEHLDTHGNEWLAQFSLVTLIDQDYELVVRVNEICRALKVRFISGSVFGWIGYAFFDFDGHNFLTKVVNPEALLCDYHDIENTSAKKTVIMTIDEEQYVQKTYSYPSFVDAFNSDWSQKKLLRRCKRIIPSSYFLIKSILTAQKEKLFNGNEENDLAVLEKIWAEEVAKGNHSTEMQTVQPDKFDHLFNPQLTPTCAVVGGMMGQEAIKALSEEKNKLRNIFIYSALDTTGIMCDFPPV